jgi:predicted phage-related endonuclease
MLTATQIEARKGKLTASRVAVLMTGDSQGILRLYQELRGEIEPEDLSRVWPVRLGEATEQLNLDWFEMKNRMPVMRRGEVMLHPDHEWAACTLDGWVEAADSGYPIEAKCVGGREPIEVVIDRYQPQLQWQMFVTGAKQIALTIIVSAHEPVVEYIDRVDTYVAEMVARAQQFMRFVERGEPPVVLDPVPPPADATKIYDMTGQNSWADPAADWLDTREASKRNADAAIVLKHLVPPDAKKCHGHGVIVTRDRAGRLSLRQHEEQI